MSCPPTVATGTIGTPERIAVRTKPLRPAKHRLIAPAPVAHSVDVTPRPDDHVAPGAERGSDALARSWDHPDLAEVVAQPGRRHEDIMSGRMKHALGAKSPPPGGHKRPGIHRQRPSGMIPDQQRGLLGQSLPPGYVEPEVVLAQDDPRQASEPASVSGWDRRGRVRSRRRHACQLGLGFPPWIPPPRASPPGTARGRRAIGLVRSGRAWERAADVRSSARGAPSG